MFSVLTWQVVTGGRLRDADERLAAALRQPDPAAPGADGGLAEFAADLGHWYVAVPALLPVLCHAWWRIRRPGPLLAVVGAMTAVPLLVAPLKALVDRAGPLGGQGYYPSGHTATAVVAYGAVALLLLPHLRGRAARSALVVPVCAVVAGVGAGLVRRGYHWPLDVAASWCLGGLLLLAVAAVTRRTSGFRAPRRGRGSAPDGVTRPGPRSPTACRTAARPARRAGSTGPGRRG
ncbi:phosphatase PAP2 family protein [Streptomyces sp. TRM70308]|uniref:phosphatase PAP2 family protein n=1 Tax=Streptomyces sp. TRM70308 TaxID=3131932 RepID=UPI003D00311D